ncbi:nuclear transport factor 2 family protein [Aestuariivivens sediminis]|uniref:nuclear transport factor 2 family protein n=1 Tax=Aestuariivivens sediminis TaxID=2913557 RepID=UPI001F599063|nr:nuclear transport factor 2 family protein [Aestuariivivens sediminis]
MKTVFTTLICSILLTLYSCGDATVERNIAMYTDTWDRIINEANLDLINNANFTEDITLVSSPENIVGIDDFKAYYSNFITGFSDVTFDIKAVFGQGENLVKHWHYTGTHTGDFFGIPATGKTVDLEGVTLVKMKDGKIAQEQDFMDNLVFMEQLGLDPFLNPENTITIRTLYENFAKGNVEGVAAVMDDDLVWNEAENFPYADGNPYHGFDAVLKGVLSRIMEEWDYWNLTHMDFLEITNNKVLVTGRYEAKYKKNGAVINLQMAHLWTLKDGKVISFQQFADTKGISDAMTK